MSKQNYLFEGFPAGLPDFLWGLAFNNEKNWFDAHREEYERCLRRPFTALAEECQAELNREYSDAFPGLHISRINRDARRLHGRGPYKDHLWFTLGQTSALYAPEPRFWFEIGSHSYGCGLGYFHADAALSQSWRDFLDKNPKKAEKLIRQFNRQDNFTHYGRLYNRPKGDPGPLLYDWYNTRDLGFEHTGWFEPDSVPGPELKEELLSGFRSLMPFYELFRTLSLS